MNHERCEPIPADFPVQPFSLEYQTQNTIIATCGHCGLSWDDAICTSYTPAPAARCPFEAFHLYPPATDDCCEDTGKPHIPDWSTVQVYSDGGQTYVDVNCSACGASGCVGNVRHLAENICW